MNRGAGTPASEKVGQRLRRELRLASRFGLVGIAATAVHVLVVLLLMQTINLPVLVANLFAFLTAFGVSFAGNYVWTFGSPGRPKTAMSRFFLISAFAFSANSLILYLLTRLQWLPPAEAAVSAAAVVPFISYLASRFWGFRVGLRWT